MSQKKIFLVFGATGAQGGSVVQSLIKDASWQIRALVRDPNSEKAQALAKQGVELVKGSYLVKEDLSAAFKDVNTAFVVTNFWDPEVGAKETEIGKNIVDAAANANIKNFIWSSLPNAKKLSQGKYHVLHFSGKAEIEDYLTEKSVPWSAVGVGFYLKNWIYFPALTPKKNSEGVVEFALSTPVTTQLAGIDVDEDTGPAVVLVANNPEKWKGKHLAVAGEPSTTVQDYARIYQEVTGEKAIAKEIPREEYNKKYKFPGSEEIAEMLDWFRDYEYFGNKSSVSPWNKNEAINLGLKPNSFKTFLQRTGWRVQ